MNKLDVLSLRDLRALVCLAEYQHFGRAAQALCISQPSLSAALQKVETCLQIKVFERTSRRCELTPRGQLIVERARRALAEVSQLAQLSQPAQTPLAGRFRLGIIPTVAPYYLPHVFGAVIEQFSTLELVLREEISDRLVALLHLGELDAALLSLPIIDSDLMQLPVAQEELALAVPTSHPLAQKQFANITDLQTPEMVLLEHGHCLRDQTMELCGASNRSASVHATSLETLRFMVKARLGYALVPALAVHHDQTRALIRYLPFRAPAPSRTLGLVALKDGVRSSEVQVLAEFLGNIDIAAMRL